MGLNQVHSGAPFEGGLSGGLFAGDHGPEGEFNSLKGRMIDAPELSYYDQDGNTGPNRLAQQVAPYDGWEKTGPIESGTFSPDALTRGTDKHMPK
jgi:hypothetical protein